MRLILATLLFLLMLPAAARAQDAAVSTGEARDIGFATATLTGAIDPQGEPRQWYFEFGTTTSYGLQTATRTTGVEAETVEAQLTGLAPSTTYNFRLVAGGVPGGNMSFRTAPAPERPGISGLRSSERTASSGRVSASIQPNNARTTWWIEWGQSTSLGSRTESQEIPAGSQAVPVSTVLTGLAPYKRIYWRVVAENAAGIRRSGRASFVTARAPASTSLSRSVAVTTWGRSVSFNGTVRGSGVNGLTVALQQSSFPFDAGFHTVATARTNRNGEFRFSPRPVYIATRFRAVPLIAPEKASSARDVAVRALVRVHRGRKTRRAVWLTGAVNPGLPAGAATLQRRARVGWRSVRTVALTPQTDFRSSYSFKVRRKRYPAVYRIRVAARNGGAHLRGYSPAISVGRKQPKPKRKRGRRD